MLASTVAFLIAPIAASGQLPTPAVPFQSWSITHAQLEDLGVESAENWGAVQGPSGRVFIANGRGVVVYDGVDWKVVETPRTTAVRSVAVGPGGRVFAGAQGEFGFLVPDSTSFRFVTLSDLVAQENASFGNVWTIRADDETVYFQARNHLFIWDGNELTTVYSEDSYHTSFLTSQGLILRERGVGLVRYEGGATRLVPGGEFFAEMRVFLLEEKPYGWFIGTRDNGFFRMSDAEITPFPTEADPLLEKDWLYASVPTPDGLILGTLGGGLIELNEQGRVTARVDSTTGLPDASITALSPIRPAGYVATTQNNGLFFFGPPGALTSWSRRRVGTANDIYLHADTLFVATGRGLQTIRIDQTPVSTRQFYDKMVYNVRSVGDRLYAGTDEGLRIWSPDSDTPVVVLKDRQVMAMAPFGDGVVAGYRDGLRIISGVEEGQEWDAVQVRAVVVVGQDIWYATLADGLHRLRQSGNGWQSYNFTIHEGLPANDRLEIVSVGEAIRVYTDDASGIYRLAGDTFVRDEDLTPIGADRDGEVWDVVESQDGTVWIGYADRIERAIPTPRGGYRIESPPALRFQRSRSAYLHAADDGTLWFNRDGEVVRYNPAVDLDRPTEFDVIIRHITTRRDGRLVESGFGKSARSLDLNAIPFAQNALSIHFAAALPTHSGELAYSWRVDPGDWWTEFDSSMVANLDDLREGDYTFQVRARDQHGLYLPKATVEFTVLPPWYRTWLAYGTYAALALLLLWFVYRYQVMAQAQKKAEQQARELEREKIYRRKLESANTRLLQASKVKDEFLAKTSHEIRTPLTAILGFTGILREEIPKEASYREFVDIIAESGDRLMVTLDDLLELAQLRAGARQLAPEPVNLYEYVDSVVGAVTPRAGEKGLYMRLTGQSDVVLKTDPEALKKILRNLLDNAVKFTERGGVNVTVTVADTCGCAGGNDCSSCVELSIADTGIGIDQEFIPNLFDEFHQESEGENRSHNGSGLGLTIVGGLVELLGGEIRVESEKGKGSTFTVRIPAEVTAASPRGAADRPAERRDPRRPTPGPGETA